VKALRVHIRAAIKQQPEDFGVGEVSRHEVSGLAETVFRIRIRSGGEQHQDRLRSSAVTEPDRDPQRCFIAAQVGIGAGFQQGA
jgi:hypothetical protein